MEYKTIGEVITQQVEPILLAPGKIPVPLSYVNSSSNWSHDERKILECEVKGPAFFKMSEAELIIAGTAVCYQISKITGILLPQQVEKAKELHMIVAKFIRNNKRFKLLTLAEVALAASWNAAGEFTNRVKHYNNELTLDYLGELLNEYCRHKQRYGLKEKLELESIKFLPENDPEWCRKNYGDPFFWEKEIEMRYQQFLNNYYNMGIWLPGMYNKLADLNILPHNNFVYFLEPAYKRVIDDIQVEYAELQSQGKPTHRLQEKYNYVFDYKHSNHYVMALSKRLAVRAHFTYCKEQGMKNLFIEEK